jgi:hypothetical protein
VVDNHGFDFFPFFFTFHTPPTSTNANTATVTFTATQTQVGVLGFFVFTGGTLGGELFTVSPDEQLGGTFDINGPPLPFSDVPATISNIDIFIGPPGQPQVPDSGSTAMLLGSGLIGLGLLRLYLNRTVSLNANHSIM